MNPVAKTSLMTAAMRAVESKRIDSEGRLFVDPYAALLADDEGVSLLDKALVESGVQPAIALRTSYIDKAIEGSLKKGIRQIVILAAGMDARAYRLHFPKGTTIFELDREEVLRYKQEKLGATRPNCEWKMLAVDLREDWTGQLSHAGLHSSEQSLWLVEGLFMYLKESEIAVLLDRINTLALPKDIMIFDVLSRSLLDEPHMEKQLKFFDSIGAPWLFGTNEPEEFMKKFGWSAVATQPGEFAPSRWPFPTAPRSVPNVPRSFFVEACKLPARS